MKIRQKSWEVDVIPISWGIDGLSPPGALTILDDINKVRYRDFAWSDSVFFEWTAPEKIIVSDGVFYQVKGWITSVTGPTNGKQLLFQLRGTSIGDGENISIGPGAFVNVVKEFVTGGISGLNLIVDTTYGVIEWFEITLRGENYQRGDILTTVPGPPGSGAIFEVIDVTDNDGQVVVVHGIVDGGSGYEIGDILTLVGGSSDGNCTVRVSGVTGGAVAEVEILTGGSGYNNTVFHAIGGHGSDCALDVYAFPAGAIIELDLVNGGSDYYPTEYLLSGGHGNLAMLEVHTMNVDIPRGTGYEVGDILTLVGISSGASNCRAEITSVDVDGRITGYIITEPGSGYQAPENLQVLGGSGSGCEMEVTAIYTIDQYTRFESDWSSESIDISNLASNKLAILELMVEESFSNPYSQPIGVGWLKLKYRKSSG